MICPVNRICLLILAAATLLLGGCFSVELGGSEDRQRSYLLTDATPDMPAANANLPVTLVLQSLSGDPLANSLSMAYAMEPGQRELYLLSRWNERPAITISRQLMQRFDRRGSFKSVVELGEGVGGELGLGLGIETIHHDAIRNPGNVQLSIRADLILRGSRELLARNTFTTTEPLNSAGPDEVALAMGRAMARLFDQLVPWVEASAGDYYVANPE
jgi:ABC-type uncharacterized transport system auxiliary subunit